MSNTLRLTAGIGTLLQRRWVCFRKQNSGSVLYFIATWKSATALRCRVRMENTRRKL